MGYKTELQSNNADLQTILNKVNALPEAGGGGGGSVETCTVTVINNSYDLVDVLFCKYNGDVANTDFETVWDESNEVFDNVVKGGYVCFINEGSNFTSMQTTNGTLIHWLNPSAYILQLDGNADNITVTIS